MDAETGRWCAGSFPHLSSYILEHAHTIDDLVSGLFVDDGNPRRTQDGADKVQELCAHALQNLALSDIGKAALRSHADVLPSLRKVATAEGGLSDDVSVAS